MELLELLDKRCIKIPLLSDTREEVLGELLDLFDAAGGLLDRQKALDAVLERELQGSTGLEKGVAIPHAKTDAVSRVLVAIGVKPGGLNFFSLDGEPTKLFFLILAPPEQAGRHIEILTEIARASKSQAFCRLLMAARTPEEALDLFREDS